MSPAASRTLRNPIAIAFAAILLLILVSATFAVVPETKQALIVRFGKPVAVVNRYQAREDFGNTGAGVIARVPFVDEIEWIDKRVQSVDMEEQQVLSTDQLRLEIDAFARYRIVDPLQMYQAAGSQERVSEALRPILGSALRNELGKRPFAALLSPERVAARALSLVETNKEFLSAAWNAATAGAEAPIDLSTGDFLTVSRLRQAAGDRPWWTLSSFNAGVAPVDASTDSAADASADADTEELCGHRNMSGRTCTRERGHSAKSHRYS